MLLVFGNNILKFAGVIVPWLALGIIFSAVMEKWFIKNDILKKYLGKFGWKEAVVVIGLGMISPMSIMPFLPLMGELASLGLSPALLLLFLIAERAYDTQAFFIIGGLFGWKLAVWNLLAIGIALLVTAWFLKREQVVFKVKKHNKDGSFFKRQVRIVLAVFLGIIVGAAVKTWFPVGWVSGTLEALVLGWGLYFGPILGNYPVAKAFADLGMTKSGVMTFLTVSPIFNFVIMVLFGSLVGFKKILKPVFVYTAVGLVLSLVWGVVQ